MPLLAAGALDAWTAHVTMKKGRPGVVVSRCSPTCPTPPAAGPLAHETGTLGVRVSVVDRWPFARQADEVEVEGLPVRIKRTALRVKVEYEDAARVARRTGLPLAGGRVPGRGRGPPHDPDPTPDPDGGTPA